jgi:hypothetical protein
VAENEAKYIVDGLDKNESFKTNLQLEQDQFLTTLTWENINVFVPQKKPGIFASQKKIEEYLAAGPKQILQNGNFNVIYLNFIEYFYYIKIINMLS